MLFWILDICIECDEESKDGDPLNNFGIRFQDSAGKFFLCEHAYQAVFSSMDDLAGNFLSNIIKKTSYIFI